jgi:hypothetical protein
MNNPNEYVGLRIAKDYMDDRQQYEESRRMIKQKMVKRPSRFYCAICRSLVSIGHVLVAFGHRLEEFDLVLRQSKAL